MCGVENFQLQISTFMALLPSRYTHSISFYFFWGSSKWKLSSSFLICLFCSCVSLGLIYDVYIIIMYKLQAFYLPWAMLALDVIFGSPITPDLMGIIAGHLYYFLTVLHPLAGGRNILKTPMWVYPFNMILLWYA